MPKSIAILAPSSVPFQLGGAEKLWWGLRQALANLPDCVAELIKIPVREDTFSEIITSYEIFSQLDLSHFDILITGKYPAWIAPHACHICYMLHPLRGLYDTYRFTGLPQMVQPVPAPLMDLVNLIRKKNPGRGDLPMLFELCRHAQKIRSLPSSLFSFPGALIREIVHFLDKIALDRANIKSFLTISRTVASRKDYLPDGIRATVLSPPSDLENFNCLEGKYFFTASRLNATKRMGMLIDAMRHMPLDIELKIAGTGPDMEALKQRAASDQRIRFLGFVSDEEMLELYANAIAVPFCPLEEDYGLITVEAMKSAKPVITTHDSGGVAELTQHNKTGIITEPTPAAIGQAMHYLAKNPDLARHMGIAAKKSVENITWEHTARIILEAAKDEPERPTVLVASPFAADALGAGGERRLYHFCARLAESYNVELICYGTQTLASPETSSALPHFNMLKLPWPVEARTQAMTWEKETGQSCDDIALMTFCNADKSLIEALSEKGANAFCAVLAHPWLHTAMHAAFPDMPLIYDAHDIEADVKATILGDHPLNEEVRKCEADLCRAARLVFACSSADAKRMSELYGCKQPALLANGCSIPAYIPEKKALRQRLAYPDTKLALFLGSGHKPNVEAALKIIDMARLIPDVQFLLAGSVCSQRPLQTGALPANVHLLGMVSEKVKNTLLAASDIALNPVTSGSGSNLKMIEYMVWKLPCVSTPFGMRGLPDEPIPTVAICSLKEFPQFIEKFISNPPEEAALQAAADHIASMYAWPKALANLNPALEELRAKICKC